MAAAAGGGGVCVRACVFVCGAGAEGVQCLSALSNVTKVPCMRVPVRVCCMRLGALPGALAAGSVRALG